MKRVIVVFILLAGLAVHIYALPASESEPPVVQITEKPYVKTVTVVGNGVAEAKPDIATVRIGVESIASSIDDALLENREALAGVVSAMIDLGIHENDVQTSNYSFNFDRSTPEPTGSRASQTTRYYRVNNMVTVVIRNLSLTADIIDAAVVAGANQMWGVEFGVADRERLDREALIAASLDARERADFLANLSDLRLGEILSVSEVVGASGTGAMFRSAAMDSSATNVHPGLMRFSAQLQVVYSLVSETIE